MAAWRRLLNGKFNFRTNLMAVFAKPLLCAWRFISTKFNFKTKCLQTEIKHQQMVTKKQQVR